MCIIIRRIWSYAISVSLQMLYLITLKMLIANSLHKQHTDGGSVRYLVHNRSKLLYSIYFLDSYNMCQNGFMYDFYCCLFLFIHLASVHVFSQKSNLQFDLVELQELPNVKVLCNVTNPQPMKTELMLRQYIAEFWTNCGKWEIKTIWDIRQCSCHSSLPVVVNDF